jgi:hypothetical protein
MQHLIKPEEWFSRGPLPNYFMAFTEISMKNVFKKKLHYFN